MSSVLATVGLLSHSSSYLLYYIELYMKMTKMHTPVLFMVVITLPYVFSQCGIGGPDDFRCEDWQVKMERLRSKGVQVSGHANTPIHNGVQGTVHGTRVFGGPQDGAQTVGAGVNYQSASGMHGGVDATHVKGQGNAYSGHIGGSTKVGPGTLSISGGAGTLPGSSKIEGQVGATYSVPLP